MPDKKKPIGKSAKGWEGRPSSKPQPSSDDSRDKKHEKFYISKPKISSQTTSSNEDNKK